MFLQFYVCSICLYICTFVNQHSYVHCTGKSCIYNAVYIYCIYIYIFQNTIYMCIISLYHRITPHQMSSSQASNSRTTFPRVHFIIKKKVQVIHILGTSRNIFEGHSDTQWRKIRKIKRKISKNLFYAFGFVGKCKGKDLDTLHLTLYVLYSQI